MARTPGAAADAMLDLGLIGFTQPWLLVAAGSTARPLAAAAHHAAGPAQGRRSRRCCFLLGLNSAEQTPARTPLWLLLLRLGAGGAAHPGARRPDPEPRTPGWPRRAGRSCSRSTTAGPPPRAGASASRLGRELIQQAGREGREVVLLPTAPVARPTAAGPDAGGRGRPTRSPRSAPSPGRSTAPAPPSGWRRSTSRTRSRSGSATASATAPARWWPPTISARRSPASGRSRPTPPRRPSGPPCCARPTTRRTTSR